MDEDNFFQANGTLPIGALAAFQVAGAYSDPTAIWCGVNAWGGTVGVYGESFLPGSTVNPGGRSAPQSTGVCGKGDLLGVVGQGTLAGGVFSGGVIPKVGFFGCTIDAGVIGAEIGAVAKTPPAFGIDVQATVVGMTVGVPTAATVAPPFIGIGVWARQVGIAVAPPDPNAPATPPLLGVDAEAQLTAYQGHSARNEAINCQSDQNRGAVFGSGAVAQLRLLPAAFGNADSPLPLGDVGDFYVRSRPNPNPNPQLPITSFTELYFCLGKFTNGRTAWAPVLLGPARPGA